MGGLQDVLDGLDALDEGVVGRGKEVVTRDWVVGTPRLRHPPDQHSTFLAPN